jgi:glycosyltransferase involved in cell wall biosynthesis
MGWDIAKVSTGMLRDAARFRPTHVFLPEFMSVLRNAPALLILRTMGVRVICRLANHPDPKPFYQRLFRDVLPRFVDTFVANSRFATERVLATGVGASRVRTIFNTLATRPVATAIDDPVVAMTKRAPTILSVGQIAPFKGTHLFVLAMLALLPRHQSAQALIIGRKPEWPPEYAEYVATIERQIAGAGMENRIRFVGQNENVPHIMRHATVLALPILQEETFGNVALEALSAGLPVVAFASGGITELVDDGVTGILCETATVDSLVNGIDAFMTNPEFRRRASTASLAKYTAPDSPYSRNAFVQAWTNLFAERN